MPGAVRQARERASRAVADPVSVGAEAFGFLLGPRSAGLHEAAHPDAPPLYASEEAKKDGASARLHAGF